MVFPHTTTNREVLRYLVGSNNPEILAYCEYMITTDDLRILSVNPEHKLMDTLSDKCALCDHAKFGDDDKMQITISPEERLEALSFMLNCTCGGKLPDTIYEDYKSFKEYGTSLNVMELLREEALNNSEFQLQYYRGIKDSNLKLDFDSFKSFVQTL